MKILIWSACVAVASVLIAVIDGSMKDNDLGFVLTLVINGVLALLAAVFCKIWDSRNKDKKEKSKK